jgi:uncharacterized metal-binding protein YceD (DUF177 family)
MHPAKPIVAIPSPVRTLYRMKVHVLQIPPDGKRFEGEDSSEVLELNSEGARAVGPITYALDVGLSDGGLWARGEVSVQVECQCVRCLEKFRRPLAVPDFACQVELHGKEMVDLTEYLREDILLVLPAHPHCDWDGNKVCKASFATPDVEPIGDHKDAWKALDKLKI